MTEEKTFEPITTQEEFDERLKARLAREREKWEKQSGVDDLRQQLEAKDEEISEIKREHYLESARRALIGELASRGVTDQGRQERERAANFRFPRPNLESIRPSAQTLAAANRAEEIRKIEYARRAAGSARS